MFNLIDLLSPITAILNKVLPDKAAAAAAEAQLKVLVLQGQLSEELTQLTAVTTAQSDIDKVEAGSSSLFVAGPRPAIMWVGAAALAYQYLLRPIWTGIALMVGHPLPSPGLPTIDQDLYQLLYAILGLGAMRSYDKMKGSDTKTVTLK